MKTKIPKKDYAQRQAACQLENILEMVAELEAADDQNREAAETTMHESPLSVQIRSEWYAPGGDAGQRIEAAEYEILLCTGGPACRIVGKLGKYCEPESAEIQYQDWGTPWTEYRIDAEQEEKLLIYCRQFYYGG